MSQQTKIFFIFISIVLSMITALPPGTNTGTPKPPIEIQKCDSTNMEVTLIKNGDYYVIPQSSSGQQPLLKTVTNAPEQITIPLTSGKTITVLRSDGVVITEDAVIYELSCAVAKKVTLTKRLDVDISKHPKKTIQQNANAKIVFKKKSMEVKGAVELGDKITMKVVPIDPAVIKFIEVKSCNASSKSVTKKIFPWSPNPIHMKQTSKDEIEFDAFRLAMDATPVITFSCDVVLCSDKNGCKVTTYEMEQNSLKNDQVKGVLVVYLSENGMLSSSSKLRSYSVGLLATMGAVLLQHQFV